MYMRWLGGNYSRYNSDQIGSAIARVVKAKMHIDAELQVVKPNWTNYEMQVNDAMEVIDNIEVLLKLWKKDN